MFSSRLKKALTAEYNKIRLESAFGVIQIITVFGLIVYGLGPVFFPQYFPWINDVSSFVYLIIGIFAYHLIVLALVKILKKDNLWIYTGYIWVVVYVTVIHLTGGPDSNLIFLLVFIPIISVSQLDPKLTRNTGLFAITLLASLIFWDKKYYTDSVYIIKHLLNVIGFSIIVIYVHNLVRDALLEKYERERLKRKFIELSELDQVKQMFLTAMSHQLRTPLSGAKWALGNVLQDSSCSNREIIQEGYNKVVTSIEIIGEMLKTAELDIGAVSITLKKVKVDVVQMIKKILVDLNYISKANGSVVETNFITTPLYILADKKMFELAMVNVVDNALRYSPKGHVSITAEAIDRNARIVIKDNGIGIDSADQEYIFQKFYRGKNAMQVDPNESGVGLYATKKILTMHGGTITLYSLVGKGTEITITVPVA